MLALLILISTIAAAFAAWRRVKTPRYDLRGKHVWLIGCSRGIGHSTAHELARRGAIVSVTSRPSSSLTALHTSLGRNAGVVAPLDICATPDKLSSAMALVHEHLPLDVVILNAAINQENKRFTHIDISKIDAIIDTNFRAALRLASLAIPALRKSRGVLCAVSSLAAYRGVPGASVYGATKAALTSFCQSLSIELYNDDVAVVCVHPGFVDTPAIRALQHPKPLMVSEKTAALHVIGAIESRCSHVGFPWLMENVVMTFATHLPTAVYNFILSENT